MTQLPGEPPRLLEFCNKQVAFVHDLISQDWEVKVEQQEATDGFGNACDYEADHRFIRCIIDMQALNFTLGQGLFADWKSGKSKGDVAQLHLNAICTAVRTGIMHYWGVFVYIDKQCADIYEISLTADDLRPAQFRREHIPQIRFAGTLDTLIELDKLRESYAKAEFLPTKNKYCKWCPVQYCQFYKGG